MIIVLELYSYVHACAESYGGMIDRSTWHDIYGDYALVWTDTILTTPITTAA